MCGVEGVWTSLIASQHNLISLHVIAHFQIASSFPIHAESSFADVAQRCGLNEDETRRILRHAISNHIFTEPRAGVLAHTATSKALVQVPYLRGWLQQACDDMWPATSRFVDAMVKWPSSEEPSETAFNIASNTKGSFFEEIAKSRTRVQKFADAMSFYSTMPGFEVGCIIDAYDWASLNGGLVVDVGGSTGAFAMELTKTVPSINVVVQDLPEVIDRARATKRQSVSGQVTFQSQNFFTEQTRKGADIYFLRMILHDWPDKYCIRILKNLIPALKPNAKILINDFCLAEPGKLSKYQERIMRFVKGS